MPKTKQEIRLEEWNSRHHTSKCKRNECVEDRCNEQRANGSKRCMKHVEKYY